MIARIVFMLVVFCLFVPRTVVGQEAAVQEEAKKATWFDKQTVWKGFDQFHFRHSSSNCYLVVPKKALPGNPWIWRARFPNFHAEMDVELISKGFHLAYFDVAGKFGCPETINRAKSFYDYLIAERGLSEKVVMEGVSRGGLFVYNWTAKYPSTVASIYCDTPVCDFRSWPGGKGVGIGSAKTWEQCLKVYGLTDQESAEYKGLPIYHAEIVAKAKIPCLHIVSENDRVVPPTENTYLLRERLAKLGHTMEVISVPEGTAKSNGHHFTHPEPAKVVAFIMANAK